MKALKIAKIIDFVVLLFGWSFMLIAFYCLFTGDTIGGLMAASVAVPMKLKKPNFSVKDYVSEKTGKTFMGVSFTQEFWKGLSLAKQACLRTNVLTGFHVREKVWLVDSEYRGQHDLASATINSLLLDKSKDTPEGLNEYELKTYNRMKEAKEAKEANKGKKGGSKSLAATAAKIQAIKDMIEEGILTPEVGADKIAAIV